jgi:hypothetical protein
VQRFPGSEGRWGGERYMRLVEEKKGRLWARKETKFLVFLIIKRCGVVLGFLNNQLGAKVDLDFFLS